MSTNDMFLIVLAFVAVFFFIFVIVKKFESPEKDEHPKEDTEEFRPFRIESSITHLPKVVTPDDESGKVEVPKPAATCFVNGHAYTAQEYDFWSIALHKVVEYTNELDYKSAYNYLLDILDTKDNDKYAYDLYKLIDASMYYMYSIRNVEGCRDLLIELCLRGIELLDGYIADVKKHIGASCVWRFPTQLLILLENADRLEEAIELCDFLASRKVKDTGYGDFLTRKEKLVKKLAKKQK